MFDTVLLYFITQSAFKSQDLDDILYAQFIATQNVFKNQDHL